MDLSYEPRSNFVQTDTPQNVSAPDEGPALHKLSPEVERAFPSPPENYKPGPTSAPRMLDEESMWYKVGTVLSSFGEQIPTSVKLKMAQQQVDHQASQDKLAWDNFYRVSALGKAQMQKQNRDAGIELMGLTPQFKAELSALKSDDIKGREGLVAAWSQIGEGLMKGGGNFIKHISKNLYSVHAMDAFLNHPDPETREQFQMMAASVGPDKMYQLEPFMNLAKSATFDWANSISAELPMETKTLMGNGELNEADFRSAMKKRMIEKEMLPSQRAAVLAYFDSADGQGFMANKNIQTNKAALAHQVKQKEASPIEQQKAEEFKKNQEEIDEYDKAIAAKQTTKYNKAYIEQKRSDNRTMMKIQSPETNPTDSPNKDFNIALNAETDGVYKSMSDIDALEEGPEKKRAYAIARRLRKQLVEEKPEASLAARESAQHDNVSKPAYTVGKNGLPQRVTGKLTEEEYKRGDNLFAMTPAQQKEYSKLDAVEQRGSMLFESANKAYGVNKSKADKFGQWLAEQDPTGLGAAAFTPDIHNYLSERDSAIGDFARSLSGEVGVLTDQDIERVKKMFSTAADTPATRKVKEKVFRRLIDINRRAVTSLIFGNKGTELDGTYTPEQAKAAQGKLFRQEIEGALGSVEALSRKDQAELKGTEATSLASPPSESVKKPGESLLDKMKKGQ